MEIQRVNRSDAEKVFIMAYNLTGAAVSAGVPVEWDCATNTDGITVTACKSGSLAGLFAGVTTTAMADSAYATIQVYGIHTQAYVSRASAGNTVGQFLSPVSDTFDGLTMSAATTSGHQYVTLMDTITASAAYSSAEQSYQHNVFIRAM